MDQFHVKIVCMALTVPPALFFQPQKTAQMIICLTGENLQANKCDLYHWDMQGGICRG